MVLIFSEKEELQSAIHEINVLAFGKKTGQSQWKTYGNPPHLLLNCPI